MKSIKIASFSLAICGLLFFLTLKKENITKIKNYVNNLSNELDAIEDYKLNSDDIDIDALLKEHGFIKGRYEILKENDKINYSLTHGYL
jgi:hypothetical protein